MKILFEKVIKLEDSYVSYGETVALPEADRIILSTAIYNDMNFFLTGNTKDFSKLYRKKINKTMILMPREFLLKNF